MKIHYKRQFGFFRYRLLDIDIGYMSTDAIPELQKFLKKLMLELEALK